MKDISYVAATIELKNILLTRDKPLHDGLKLKHFERVILFDEFVRTSLK